MKSSDSVVVSPTPLGTWLAELKAGDEVAVEGLPGCFLQFRGLHRVASRSDATIRIEIYPGKQDGYSPITGLARDPGGPRSRITRVTAEHRSLVEQRRRQLLLSRLFATRMDHVTPEQFDEALAVFRATLGLS